MWRVAWLSLLPWISPLAPLQHPPSPAPLPPSVPLPFPEIYLNISRSPKGIIKPMSKVKNKSGRRSILINEREMARADASDLGNRSLQLAAALRRQLMQDNYDYMPSDSAPKDTDTEHGQQLSHSHLAPPRAHHPPPHTPHPPPPHTPHRLSDEDDGPPPPHNRDPYPRSPSYAPFPGTGPHAPSTLYPPSIPYEYEERRLQALASRRPPGGNYYEMAPKFKSSARSHQPSTSISSTVDGFITLFDKDTWKAQSERGTPGVDPDFMKKSANINTNVFNSFEKIKPTTTQRPTSIRNTNNYYNRNPSTKVIKSSKYDDWEVFREPLDNLQDSNFDISNGSRYNTGYFRFEDTTTTIYSTARWGFGPNQPYPHIDLTKKSRDTDSEKDYEQYLMKKLEPIMVMNNKANAHYNRKVNSAKKFEAVRHGLKSMDDQVPNVDHIHLDKRGDVSKKGKVASFETGIVQRARDPDYESQAYINNKLNQAFKARVTMKFHEHQDPYHLLKNSTSDTKVNHADLLYYVDDTRLSDPGKLTFHADTPQNKMPDTRRSNTNNEKITTPFDNITIINDKHYKVLKLKSDNRRMGGADRRFIQEEGADGVSIVKVDPGPFPEFLLPGDRRQYMRHDDLSDSGSEMDLPDSPESNEISSNTSIFNRVSFVNDLKVEGDSTVKSLTSIKLDGFRDPNASEVSVE